MDAAAPTIPPGEVTKSVAQPNSASTSALLDHLRRPCNTIAYAHHVGIVHCDIKPSNIMIGKFGETYVLDWGLAANFQRSETVAASSEPTVRPHSGGSGLITDSRGG